MEFLAARDGAGVTELATGLKLHKSTIFRLLGTLETRGLVEQDVERGKYRLGHTVVLLAAGAKKARDLAEISHPICGELADEVGETVNLAVRDEFEAVTITQVVGPSAVAAIDWPGKRHPLHCTAAGKVFLAGMPEPELDRLLATRLTRYTPATIGDAKTMRKHLESVRRLGYGTAYEENEAGLSAVSVPVRSLGDGVLAALTVSGPSFRIDEASIPDLLVPLRAAADQISWRCGHIKLG